MQYGVLMCGLTQDFVTMAQYLSSWAAYVSRSESRGMFRLRGTMDAYCKQDHMTESTSSTPGDAYLSPPNSFLTVRARVAVGEGSGLSYFKRRRHTRLRNKLQVVARAFCGYHWSSSLVQFPLGYQAPLLSKAMAVLRRLIIIYFEPRQIRLARVWWLAYHCRLLAYSRK